MTVAAIVVTYNRRQLLRTCLLAIGQQSRAPDIVIIVDNASTDATSEWLRGWLPEHLSKSILVTLKENTGGAGGFAAGIEHALVAGADWVWMMDDDAEPQPTALEELMVLADEPGNVYGSLATNGEATAWPITLSIHPKRTLAKSEDVPEKGQVDSLPFLGFMIHRDLVLRIGLPDRGYFIAADDTEYCIRATRAGARIFIAGKSQIEHPKTEHDTIRVFGTNVNYLRLAPWKRYYDTRNRLLIARKYYGFRLVTQTIPGSFVRLFAALWHEPHRPAQLWAFCAGMIDGLLGLKGRRHTKWGIRQ